MYAAYDVLFKIGRINCNEKIQSEECIYVGSAYDTNLIFLRGETY